MKIKIENVLNKIAKNGTTKLCSIKTIGKNGEAIWIGGFGNATTESWQKGQEVELEVYQEEYQGKVNWKFKEPPVRSVFVELDAINAKIDDIRSMVYGMARPSTLSTKTSTIAPQQQKTPFQQEVEDLTGDFGDKGTKEPMPVDFLA